MQNLGGRIGGGPEMLVEDGQILTKPQEMVELISGYQLDHQTTFQGI